MKTSQVKGDWGESFDQFPAKPARVLSDYEKVELDRMTPLKRETPPEREKDDLRLQAQKQDLKNLLEEIGASGQKIEK